MHCLADFLIAFAVTSKVNSFYKFWPVFKLHIFVEGWLTKCLFPTKKQQFLIFKPHVQFSFVKLNLELIRSVVLSFSLNITILLSILIKFSPSFKTVIFTWVTFLWWFDLPYSSKKECTEPYIHTIQKVFTLPGILFNWPMIQSEVRQRIIKYQPSSIKVGVRKGCILVPFCIPSVGTYSDDTAILYWYKN